MFLHMCGRGYVFTYTLVMLVICTENYLIHSFIPDIYIVPLQVNYYSEALLTTARILCQS